MDRSQKAAGQSRVRPRDSSEMGHGRAFVLDLRRMAVLPVTAVWFADLHAADRGIVGRAPERLRVELETAATGLFRRRPEVIERLGPLWPGGRH